MTNKIRVAILGYGNLGRGVEAAMPYNPDMELTAIFTRRAPETLHPLTKVPVYHVDDLLSMKDSIDVLILCGGSATDLPVQSPEFAKHFNIVDSFDNHSKIPAHFEAVDASACAAGKTALISAGWDPGMFSLQRLLGNAVLPEGRDYTIPVEDSLERVRAGENPDLSTREKHTRECFVVAEEGADLSRIEHEIKTMPAYFEPYDTTVHFITQEELDRDHSGIPHGGFVLRSGVTGLNGETRQMIEYRLTLGSNPEFTASALVACARAVVRMHREGMHGCKTIFDVPPAYLSPKTGAELRKALL